MKSASNKSTPRFSTMRKSSSRTEARQRFRQMMFESLEGRALLAGVVVPVDAWKTAQFVNNEVMVRFNSNITQAQAASELFIRQGATIKQWWSQLNLAEVRLPMAFANTDSQIGLIEAIHSWTDVYYAEPNFIMHPALVPNDPLINQQWALQNIGQPIGPQPPLPPPPFGSSLPPGTPSDDINATQAWNFTKGDPTAIIAVVDTGVDYNHPDLAANMWTNPNDPPDGIDNDGNGFVDDFRGWNFGGTNGNGIPNNDPNDDFGHGTHVAGIIAAVGNNGVGGAGVAFGAKIMAIKSSDNTGAFTSASIAGAQLYIAMMRTQFHVNIVASNNSYGGYTPFSFTEFDAISIATAAGIPFVVAAGNGATNNDAVPFYPANYNLPGVIAVAATDNNDLLASFSQYGKTTVTIAAPGVGILSTVPTDPAITISAPSGYAILDGTSMASPMVAGAVGLLRSFDPTLTVAQVKDFIIRGGDFRQNLNTTINSSRRLDVKGSLDLVPRNEIKGTVFEDDNASQTKDFGEGGVGGVTVYLDLNNNGVLNAGEPSTVSLLDGSFDLRGLFGPGTFAVREVVPPDFSQTLPAANGFNTVTLNSRTDVVSNVLFGLFPLPGEIHGRKWSDLDGDGIMDAGEPGIQGVVIYVDTNNDGKIGISEPAAVTDQNGNYTILNIQPGTYNVREVYQPGYVQVFPNPNGPTQGANAGVVVKHGITAGVNFGNKAAYDYGDAPAPYPTLKSQNGAVHGILQGFGLGATVDAEPDGQPKVGAIGDDFSGNEVESVTISGTKPTAGTFTLTYAGQTTIPIAYNATATAVKAALQALTNIGLGQVAVSGGIGPTTPWIVTFQGTLAGKDIPQMTANGSLLFPVGAKVTVATQQNGGINDEDGVVLGGLLPGGTGTATVTVQTGSFAAGFLQGFVDFNKDGDWNDPGEQVFKDVQLTTGTYNLSFPVPAASGLGQTYARFRFSLDRGIGPTGLALGGEVEDYAVNVLSDAPVAVDDPSPNDTSFTVDNNSFQNPLDVLKNDFPSATGPALIDPSGLDLTGTLGSVQLDASGDFYLYTPPTNFVGLDTFKYRDRDPSGHVSAPGKVTVTVKFVPQDPIAVDNTFDVLTNSNSNPLDVLANDVIGTGGTLSFQTQAPPIAANGTVLLAPGGKSYLYTPNAGFTGEDSFTYTVIDSVNKSSTATVTLQVLPAPRTPFASAIVKFELQVWVNGIQQLDTSVIPLGTTIEVRGIVTDLRSPAVTDPVSLQQFAGAFSAYMDMLYDKSKVQPLGSITFGPQYQNATSGQGGTPGLIDEIGSTFSDGTVNSPGTSPKLVFRKEFMTIGAGTLQFVADPADIAPDHDITAFVVDNSVPANSKIDTIPSSEVYFEPSFAGTSVMGEGEGEDTNLLVPVDVNLDGKVSPIDALLVINYLNQQIDAGASGEDSPVAFKRDVNHDNQISPIDALLVVNYLNRFPSAAPAGEGEGAANSAPLSPLALSVTGSGSGSSQGSSSSSDTSRVAGADHASSVDQVFGQTDWTNSSVSRTEDAPWSQPTHDDEDFLTGIGTSVRRSLKG